METTRSRSPQSSAAPSRGRKRRRRSTLSCDDSSPLSEIQWPAPVKDMVAARDFIREIVTRSCKVLIVPDKDADGLSAGTILYKTLVYLGHPPHLIQVHLLAKGNNVHCDHERRAMMACEADRVIVLDQGSRPGRPIVPTVRGEEKVKVLIIDHHMTSQWPDDAEVLTACQTEPIATTSVLTYLMVRELHPSVEAREEWRAVIGLIGDLGNGRQWKVQPWPPSFAELSKTHGSKVFAEAVSALNAPRRTADYDVQKAWNIFLNASRPNAIAANAFLKLCKIEVVDATAQWTRTGPRFSKDGRVAVIQIESACQVHPIIATRWSGTLGRKSDKLRMVMCANSSYNPDPTLISFSCRAPKSNNSNSKVDLMGLLTEYADTIPGFYDRVGHNYARGHQEATGGIIPKVDFESLLQSMGVSQPESKPRNPCQDSQQRIQAYFRPVPREET